MNRAGSHSSAEGQGLCQPGCEQVGREGIPVTVEYQKGWDQRSESAEFPCRRNSDDRPGSAGAVWPNKTGRDCRHARGRFEPVLRYSSGCRLRSSSVSQRPAMARTRCSRISTTRIRCRADASDWICHGAGWTSRSPNGRYTPGGETDPQHDERRRRFWVGLSRGQVRQRRGLDARRSAPVDGPADDLPVQPG